MQTRVWPLAFLWTTPRPLEEFGRASEIPGISTVVTPRRSCNLNYATMRPGPKIIESLHEQIIEVFQGAQNESSLHKRRVKTLCKLHVQAATFVEDGKQAGQANRVGEKKFNRAFWRTIVHVLVIRKGVVEADRAVRLVGAFVQQLTTESGMSPFKIFPRS